jgi:K+-sensing histidine kinase KdpD
LQSLYALASAGSVEAQKPKPDIDRRPPSPYEALLGRQLPQLTKRLQTTLDKLQNPAVNTHGVTMRASEWWAEVLARHADTGVKFHAAGEMTELIPAALFDTVLENCLENARQKKQREPDIEISVEYSCKPSPKLSITDTGSAISSAAMENLFRAPIVDSSSSGLGIGLFQAAKQAEQEGYELYATHNSPHFVCFNLVNRL